MESRMACRGALIVVALAAGSLLAADANNQQLAKRGFDWPQWRGPLRDGVSTETGLLKAWGEKGPPLAWRAAGLGQGYSSVSIADGRIFTLGKRGKDEFIIALDANHEGQELWAARLGDAWRDGPRGTPTVDQGLVFAVGPHGDLVCVEAATGKEVWRKSYQKSFGGKMMSGWGYCESPLVDGDRLICTPGAKDAGIVALNKNTGELIWKCEIPKLGDQGRDGAGYSSIVITEAAGVRQYVQLLGRGCVGIAAADGKFLWGYNKIANGTANIPTPIVRGDFVFCTSGYGEGGAALLKLSREGDGIAAHEVYYYPAKKLQNHHGGLVLVGDYIYGGRGHNNGFPVCIEMQTGKIAWSKDRGPGTGSAAVVSADGELYFRYENGLMALIEATPQGYKEHGTFMIPDVHNPSWAHPVVAGGKLYLREQDNLFVYQIAEN